MKKKTKDYLRFTDINIYQDDEMFCVNTDTALLGKFIDFKKYQSVLDIGTNNGALLLYASLKAPRLLCGIDINEKALSLAKENLDMNEVEAELYHTRVQDFKHEPFDIIITNPPFFEMHNPKHNQYKKMAMFEDNLVLDELFKSFINLSKDNSSIFVVYPSNRFAEFYNMCLKYKYKMMVLQFVYDKNKDEALRFLVKLKRGQMTKIKILQPIMIENGIILE